MRILKNITAIFFFFFITGKTFADNKVGFIDIDFLIESSIFGKKISQDLNKIYNNDKKKINSIEKKLVEQENEIKKVQNIISKEELNVKILKLREDIKIFDTEKKNTAKKFNDAKSTKVKDFFDKINPLISDYMEKKSIDIIIEKKNIFIGKNTHDITNEILEIINSKFN
jgi:Skp family chaperone for outer membrane proteins